MDLDPGNLELNECEVNMNDNLIENILRSCSVENSTVVVHAEDPTICADNTSKQKQLDLQILKNQTSRNGRTADHPYQNPQVFLKLQTLEENIILGYISHI